MKQSQPGVNGNGSTSKNWMSKLPYAMVIIPVVGIVINYLL
jgi:hypothetical protein